MGDRKDSLSHAGSSSDRRGRLGPSMSAAQRQEVAASAAGAVEQAVLRSLGVLDEQARALSRQASAEEPSRTTGGALHPAHLDDSITDRGQEAPPIDL